MFASVLLKNWSEMSSVPSSRTLNAAIGTTLGVRSMADVAKNASFVAASDSLISLVSVTIVVPCMEYRRGSSYWFAAFCASVFPDRVRYGGSPVTQHQIQ